MILVTGATGTVGSGVLTGLVEHGEQVRGVSRRPAGPAHGGVEWFAGDLSDAATLGGLADGADAVFLVTSGEDGPNQARNVLARAEQAGVRQIVGLSALSVGHGAADPISTWHRAAEETLQAGPIPWCILRPGGFMSNTLAWADSIRHAGSVYAPFADGRTAVIDPGDISACAVSCLLEPGHAGQAYELTGPESLSIGEQVKIIGKVIGRELADVEVPPEAARQAMVDAGMPPAAADAVLGTLEAARSDFAGTVTGTVPEITGRPATSFEDWVSAHQASFR
jgi:uncharacterized protein YbjT (DUF2867 family)